MKRIVAFILSLVLATTFCGCTSKEPTEMRVALTTENIRNYLKIEVSSNDYKTENDSDPLLRIYQVYSGTGTVTISTINQIDAHFENVSIKLRVSIPLNGEYSVEAQRSRYICTSGWVFDTENGHEEVSLDGISPDWINYKDFEITLPYDGNWTTNEGLHYKTYDFQTFRTPKLAPKFIIDILEVSGTVLLTRESNIRAILA